MRKSLLTTSILLALSMTASAQEYRMMLNYNFSTGEPITTGTSPVGGGGGGSETPSEPVITDTPGEPTVWEQYAIDNGLARMNDAYYGGQFGYLQLENLSGDPLPTENYPVDAVGIIDISNSPALSEINSLGSVKSISYMSNISPVLAVSGNINLANLAGLQNVIGGVYSANINQNSSLTSISGISGFVLSGENPASLTISKNDSLVSVSGIEGLITSKNSYGKQAIRELYIRENPLLTDISALSSLDPSSSNHLETNLVQIQLNDNAISDISPLGHLVNVRTTINLSGNQIVDPSPLNGLTFSSGGLDLSNNQITATNDLSTMSFMASSAIIDYSYNPVDDISGLGGHTGPQKVILDDRVFSVKMPTSSYLCQLNGASYNFEAVLEKTGGLGTFAYSEVCGD